MPNVACCNDAQTLLFDRSHPRLRNFDRACHRSAATIPLQTKRQNKIGRRAILWNPGGRRFKIEPVLRAGADRIEQVLPEIKPSETTKDAAQLWGNERHMSLKAPALMTVVNW